MNAIRIAPDIAVRGDAIGIGGRDAAEYESRAARTSAQRLRRGGAGHRHGSQTLNNGSSALIHTLAPSSSACVTTSGTSRRSRRYGTVLSAVCSVR